MELNEMEKKLLFQVEGDYQTKILNELYMTVRYSNNSEQREAAEGLMAKLRVLSNAECMDLVKDIQKNYRLPYPARTIGEKIAEARQQSGAEKLKGHDIMALERFDPEVKHMQPLWMFFRIALRYRMLPEQSPRHRTTDEAISGRRFPGVLL